MLRVVVLLLAMAVPALAVEGGVCVENASIGELQDALTAGKTSAADLVRAYTARIEAYDRAGPRLNAVRELNPEALAIAAAARRAEAGKAAAARRHPDPLEGQHRHRRRPAHHRRLAGARRCPSRARRHGGEAACAMPAPSSSARRISPSSPISSRSTCRPAIPRSAARSAIPLRPRSTTRAFPLVSPGGSSSGSAVAVAAGLAAVAIGTETSGSLLSPANQNGVVTVKPTVGLISRAGIIPIAHSQDTAGPAHPHRARRRDPAQRAGGPGSRRRGDARLAAPGRLHRGPRQGRPARRAHRHSERSRLIPPTTSITARCRRAPPRSCAMRSPCWKPPAPSLVHANIPTIGWMGGPGTDGPHPQPQSGKPDPQPDGAASDSSTSMSSSTTSTPICATGPRAPRCARWRTSSPSTMPMPSARCASARTSSSPRRRREGDLERGRIRHGAADGYPRHAHARDRCLYGRPQARCHPVSRPQRRRHRGQGRLSERAGAGRNDRRRRAEPTPEYPFGATFAGRAWSEPVLLRLAYAFEQATKARRMPPGYPALTSGCSEAASMPSRQ